MRCLMKPPARNRCRVRVALRAGLGQDRPFGGTAEFARNQTFNQQ